MVLLALIASGPRTGLAGGVALFTLAGMMLSSLAGALTSLAISLAPNPFALTEIVTWLMGALTDRSWHDVALAAPLTALGLAVLWRAGPALDALTLGELAARSMGLDPATLRWMMVSASAWWWGRRGGGRGDRLRRPDGAAYRAPVHRSSPLQPAAAQCAGRRAVAAAGRCAVPRLPLAGGELRLGIALSLLGAPFFLHLLLRLRRGLA
jgi:iron complex transport system permease protein